MASNSVRTSSDRLLLVAIAVLVAGYFAYMLGSPSSSGTAHGPTSAHPAPADSADEHADEHAEAPADEHAEAPADEHAEAHHDAGPMPHYFAIIPFILLLGCVALLPLMTRTEHWWEHNLHRFYVAMGLAVVTLLYYWTLYPAGGWAKVTTVLDHAVLAEYIPFIVLLFSLYTISGGIRIEGDLVARPMTNVVFITVGGLLASFIGTTGAAMLLIRPLLDTNDERKHVQHTIVFFIFVVCNCGGCLLPIGDPPLFLGYLKGVPFLWTMEHLWVPWVAMNGMLIAVYFVTDTFVYYPKEVARDIRRDRAETRPISIRGLWPNVVLLMGVILAVAFLDPTKPIGGWRPWPFLREVTQLGLVAGSLALGSQQIRVANRFNYSAILEVAALFIGIFICMQPAIEILRAQGSQLGLTTPGQMYWATGFLSSVLDNAPTYVVFYETAASDAHFASAEFHQLVTQPGDVADQARDMLTGISLGAVFMGAMTYIGNGPNFMVRAIAEQSGIRMPSFFGYVARYSIPFMLPVLAVVWYLFLVK